MLFYNIVDFYCPRANLIIELDRGQHYTEESIKKDRRRENYLKEQGYRVIRFSKKLKGVSERIYEVL